MGWLFHKHSRRQDIHAGPMASIDGGEWYWMRTPEQEKTIVMGLYNRYCIRCHGVDGRGVWDIPGVPDFTDVRWQNSRTDAEIVRILIEGRGAVMPSFRGTIALDECWGLAHYLRSFVPGTEVSRPVLRDHQANPRLHQPDRHDRRNDLQSRPFPSLADSRRDVSRGLRMGPAQPIGVRLPQTPLIVPACALDSLRARREWETIVMVALADLPPAAAWMTAVPERDGAVYRPVELIEPRPLTFDQVKLGWTARGWTNWSSAWAENCCFVP